jgi:hypothetical protein
MRSRVTELNRPVDADLRLTIRVEVVPHLTDDGLDDADAGRAFKRLVRKLLWVSRHQPVRERSR